MSTYRLVYTSQAKNDARKINSTGLKAKVEELLDILRDDPFQEYPPYEKLLGELKGTCSRRIIIQYRLVYQVYEEEKVVKVIRMWTHYE